jgi:hypothetical protein
MRKITLDVDALEVESFDTSTKDAEERGTVRGHNDQSYPNWGCPFSWGTYCSPSASGEIVCECADPSLDPCSSECTRTSVLQFCYC